MNSHHPGEGSPAPITAASGVCASLALGLHAAAQPLTILLAGLGKGHTDRMDLAELRELTASAAIEVQRVCSLFTSLQQLIMAESMQAELSALSILPVLTHVTQGLNLVFEKDGVRLRVQAPESCPLVRIDRDRTHQALSSILLVVRALCHASDTVELIVSCSAHGVQMVVRNTNVIIEGLPADASLKMALAETNIRKQQGGFCCTLRPFRVQIDLPLATEEMPF